MLNFKIWIVQTLIWILIVLLLGEIQSFTLTLEDLKVQKFQALAPAKKQNRKQEIKES